MNKPWRISLFGGLRVEGFQTTITRFNSQKTAGLLAYLAQPPLAVTGGNLAPLGCFWEGGRVQ